MLYPLLTLSDQTEMLYSEIKPDRRVKVYVEKPDAKDCFHNAVCWLPGDTWEGIFGFTPAEIRRYEQLIRAEAHRIPCRPL